MNAYTYIYSIIILLSYKNIVTFRRIYYLVQKKKNTIHNIKVLLITANFGCLKHLDHSLRIMSGPRIAITQYDVMQPVWHNTFGVHQVPDGLQHGFEVVLFRFATHEDVERFIDIL